MAKKTKIKSIFAVVKKTQKNKDLATSRKVPTQREMIRYILATMLFKRGTILFVKNLDRKLESGQRLSRKQSVTLKAVYTEWIDGRVKVAAARKQSLALKKGGK